MRERSAKPNPERIWQNLHKKQNFEFTMQVAKKSLELWNCVQCFLHKTSAYDLQICTQVFGASEQLHVPLIQWNHPRFKTRVGISQGVGPNSSENCCHCFSTSGHHATEVPSTGPTLMSQAQLDICWRCHRNQKFGRLEACKKDMSKPFPWKFLSAGGFFFFLTPIFRSRYVYV